jgi:hypothetical protein
MPASRPISKPSGSLDVTLARFLARGLPRRPDRGPPVIQFAAAGVRFGVIARTTPNHPLRLAGLFAASLAFFAIVAGAAGAMAWVVRDARSSNVAGASVAPPTQADLNLPPGVIALQRVADADQYKQLTGFKPFIPDRLPAHTKDDLSLAVALPDDNGVRAGRVGFSAADWTGPDGITGPIVVLWETKGAPPEESDFTSARGNGRALVATIACKDLTLSLELVFNPAPAPGDQVVTPYMTDTAATFLDGLREQCR